MVDETSVVTWWYLIGAHSGKWIYLSGTSFLGIMTGDKGVVGGRVHSGASIYYWRGAYGFEMCICIYMMH